MEPTSLLRVIVDERTIRELAKEEIRKLLEESGEGCWWDLKRLETETCRKRDWLLENILLNPEFKSEMALITNNRAGGRWMFRAVEMREFLNRHFHQLNRPTRTG